MCSAFSALLSAALMSVLHRNRQVDAFSDTIDWLQQYYVLMANVLDILR